jgi:fatty acid desaturase
MNMQKIKLWFWISLNTLGMALFFNVASKGWYYDIPEEKITFGSPMIGDGILFIFLLLILFVFLIFNLIALIPIKRYIRSNSNKKLLYAWFLIAGLWFSAIIYDFYRTPTYMDIDDYEKLNQTAVKPVAMAE